MYRCDCGRFVFDLLNLGEKKYCADCAPHCELCGRTVGVGVTYVMAEKFFCEACYPAVQPRCYVCSRSIDDKYHETPWGNVCQNCFRPERVCFTCGVQLKAGQELRLADYRVSCPTCAATAVYKVDKSLVLEVKRRLRWFPRKHISFGTVDVRKLHELRPVKSGTLLGMCQTITAQTLTCVHVVKHQILILFGLPREICEASLVHELFHAWIHENVPIDRYTEAETEWLCEHMAFNFLRSIKAQDHWIRRIESSRDQYPEVRDLKNHGQETIVRFLKR